MPHARLCVDFFVMIHATVSGRLWTSSPYVGIGVCLKFQVLLLAWCSMNYEVSPYLTVGQFHCNDYNNNTDLG